MRVKEFFGRFFKVHKCGGCRRVLDYEYMDKAFCPECKLKWNAAKIESCKACNQSAAECLCMPKGLSATGAICLCKMFFYSASRANAPQNRALYLLKRQPIRRVASFFAKELKDGVQREIYILGKEIKKDMIAVNVPRGVKARAAFGFDQSELVCRELAHELNIPYVNALSRKKGGKEQKKLDRDRRFRNVSELFCITNGVDVSGKHVLLFDDIVTTGASMAACVKILKKAGAKDVICACIAVD